MAWVFQGVVETWVDMADKTRVIVSVTDGVRTECLMLKFQHTPTLGEIQAEAAKPIYLLNNPPVPEPTLDELKQIVVGRDLTILELSGLRDQVKVILQGVGTATQKITQLKALLGV
jgi:hypothetical protein